MKKATEIKEPTPLASFEDIQNAVAAPILIEFKANGKRCQIEARKLRPNEDQLLVLQGYEIMPPVLRGKTEAEDRLDQFNKDYLVKKAIGEREIRAQGVFWACKMLQDKLASTNKAAVDGMYKPENRKAIVEFIQATFVEDLLNYLWNQISNSNLTVPQKVNFT